MQKVGDDTLQTMRSSLVGRCIRLMLYVFALRVAWHAFLIGQHRKSGFAPQCGDAQQHFPYCIS